ncbi:hypothetical protein SBA2_800027 [Acidobacteriia bacterium SbA2]|nr:hypothetical protein SBA2_800027 [Acidobacteriia bacterium SbA2]
MMVSSPITRRGWRKSFEGRSQKTVGGSKEASVQSQKLVNKVFLICARLSEPREGRHRVAQGESPGLDDPHPAFGTPLPLRRERGWG